MMIDLNADVGEGAPFDAELMTLITSANVACGAHAGNVELMRRTMESAAAHGVSVGAHPGFADPGHFGRRELKVREAELRTLIISQIEALRALGRVRHVKPHGGLYNLAARDRATAEIVAAAVHGVDPRLLLFALAGSELAKAGRTAGLRVIEEAFADRRYEADGTLTSRSDPGALIGDENEAVTQVLRLVQHGHVRAANGADIRVHADTICLHGDALGAVDFARRIRRELAGAQIEVKAP